MPLTEKVTFTVKLHGANLVRIPKLIRWRFKMEPEQVLRVKFTIPHAGRGLDAILFENGKRWTTPHPENCA